MRRIHPTAIVDPSAELGDDVSVGPYAVIEPGTALGDGCSVGAHAVIKQYSRLGCRNAIHEHAIIGGTPQDLGFRPCVSYADIGDDNAIREGVTIHRAASQDAVTRIGNNNYLMAYCHIAHDCAVGNRVIIANNALLAGHVQVADRAFISGAVGIHQFCKIGALAMVGNNSKVNLDCLPFVVTDGVPARARGLNVVGLRRAGISAEDRRQLRGAYRLLLQSRLTLEQALEQLAGFRSPLVRELTHFIENSSRGFAHTAD